MRRATWGAIARRVGWMAAGAITLAVSPVPGVGQETIASDRPGIGSGSFVLGRGAVQVESGVSLSQAAGVRDYRVGHLLVRVGAGPVEFNAILNSLVATRSAALDDEGVEDVGLGAKTRLLQTVDGVVALSLLATVTIPTGSAFLTSDEVIPAATLLLDYAASQRVALAANIGYTAGVGQASDVVMLTATSTTSLTPTVGAYIGYAGFYSSGTGRHFAEAGVTGLVNSELQLDFNGGVDVETGDYFIGVGIAVRILPGN